MIITLGQRGTGSSLDSVCQGFNYSVEGILDERHLDEVRVTLIGKPGFMTNESKSNACVLGRVPWPGCAWISGILCVDVHKTDSNRIVTGGVDSQVAGLCRFACAASLGCLDRSRHFAIVGALIMCVAVASLRIIHMHSTV